MTSFIGTSHGILSLDLEASSTNRAALLVHHAAASPTTGHLYPAALGVLLAVQPRIGVFHSNVWLPVTQLAGAAIADNIVRHHAIASVVP